MVACTRSILSHKKILFFLQHTEVTGGKNHTIGTVNCTEENFLQHRSHCFFPSSFDNKKSGGEKKIISFYSPLKNVTFFSTVPIESSQRQREEGAGHARIHTRVHLGWLMEQQAE